jgi:hypothetical protein
LAQKVFEKIPEIYFFFNGTLAAACRDAPGLMAKHMHRIFMAFFLHFPFFRFTLPCLFFFLFFLVFPSFHPSPLPFF